MYKVKDADELNNIIMRAEVNEDLNHLDVRKVTNFSLLFNNTKFNGDISKWDVSNVDHFYGTFLNSAFNGDISNWDVSSGEDFSNMFKDSIFDGDISKWNVSNGVYFTNMFRDSMFSREIGKWDVSNAINLQGMFRNNEKWDGDISDWNMGKVKDISYMFCDSIWSGRGGVKKWKLNKPHTTNWFIGSQHSDILFELLLNQLSTLSIDSLKDIIYDHNEIKSTLNNHYDNIGGDKFDNFKKKLKAYREYVINILKELPVFGTFIYIGGNK